MVDFKIGYCKMSLQIATELQQPNYYLASIKFYIILSIVPFNRFIDTKNISSLLLLIDWFERKNCAILNLSFMFSLRYRVLIITAKIEKLTINYICTIAIIYSQWIDINDTLNINSKHFCSSESTSKLKNVDFTRTQEIFFWYYRDYIDWIQKVTHT